MNERVPFVQRMQAWQERDFGALDAAWKRLAGISADEAISARIQRRAYIERPRGHSKTADMAIQLAWILLFANSPVNGIAAAADLDQASLILNALKLFCRANPGLCTGIEFRQYKAINKRNGSVLTVISSDADSSWGATPDFIICDELCHWSGPQMWHSLFSAAAKKKHCVLAVLTNAGIGRGWEWEVRERARKHPAWHFSSLDGSIAPWIDQDALAEQRDLLPPSVYERLWENRWQHSDGEFVTLVEAEGCINTDLEIAEHGSSGVQYYAAVDYAEKHDYTVAVLLHREGGRLIVDRIDLAVPSRDEIVPVCWVEDWIERIANDFGAVSFVLDDYQLAGVYQKLSPRYQLSRFDFAGGQGNHTLALMLRSMILNRQIKWYPGCGQHPDKSERDDLATELASLLLKQRANGRVRIDHKHGLHDDRCFALGAAVMLAMQQDVPTERDTLEVHSPDSDGGFFW
ncbi:terminase large subunit domain-containing protein [Calycomorphotria hydatis]|uniref:Phage Terminase n=1 Tax=Calycomorphotria hydatis TaxID=2528027 RepID=A0A517TFA9_9PLAN|nr:terminase large subunit [Calycomorphotria hydatis]QDT67052.1 Phage Terminase [Calycomorphotria hydatis]